MEQLGLSYINVDDFLLALKKINENETLILYHDKIIHGFFFKQNDKYNFYFGTFDLSTCSSYQFSIDNKDEIEGLITSKLLNFQYSFTIKVIDKSCLDKAIKESIKNYLSKQISKNESVIFRIQNNIKENAGKIVKLSSYEENALGILLCAVANDDDYYYVIVSVTDNKLHLTPTLGKLNYATNEEIQPYLGVIKSSEMKGKEFLKIIDNLNVDVRFTDFKCGDFYEKSLY